jgi:hypothetical protein
MANNIDVKDATGTTRTVKTTETAGVNIPHHNIDSMPTQGSATGGAAATVSALAGGKYNATLPALTDGQQAALQLDAFGNLLVGPDGAPVSGSVSSAAVLFTADMLGYESISVQCTSAGTGCTITYETSDDQTTWVSTLGCGPDQFSIRAHVKTTTNTTGLVVFPRRARYFRARVSTYGSGTVTVVGSLSKARYPLTMLAAASVFPNSNFAGTPGFARIQSAATTNAANVKANPGVLTHYDIGNSGATDAWIKFYNKASAPTVGTDTPVATIYLPKGQRICDDPTGAIGFTTGVAYAITGGAADSDTTAVAANQITGYLLWS